MTVIQSEKGSTMIPSFASEKDRKKYFASVQDKDRIRVFNEILRTSRHTVFLSGPGISAQCGVSDFRAARSWTLPGSRKPKKYHPEYLLSEECLRSEPEVFFQYFCSEIDVRGAACSITHRKLAQMEQAGLLHGIITLNVDGLHQKAGSKNVQEIFGTALECRCVSCGAIYSSDLIFQKKGAIPLCPVCSRMLRPMMTLYGELMPEEAMNNAGRLIDEADCLIVGGSTLRGGAAYSLAARFRGRFLVIINAGKTKMDGRADLLFHAGADRIMRQIRI